MALVLLLLIAGFLKKDPFFFKPALLVLILNMVIPGIFKPVAVVWLAFSHILGSVTSKILLTLIFFFVVTPVGLLMRLSGRDVLKLKEFKQGNQSIMQVRNIMFTRKEIDKPF